MPGRYSDRFLQNQPSSTDVIELGELDSHAAGTADAARPEPFPGPPRPWHAHAGARIAVAAAFVAGTLLGAYGWNRQRDHQALVAEMGAVDVSAWVTSTGFTGSTGLQAQVHYRNEGSHPISIVDLIVGDGRSVSVTDREVTMIDPGEEAVQRVGLELRCDADPASEPGAAWEDGLPQSQPPVELTLDVQTADGAGRQATVQASLDRQVLEWLSWGCDSAEPPTFSEVWVYPFSVQTQDDGTVHATYSMEGSLQELPAVEIFGAELDTDAYAVELIDTTGRPIRLAQIELVWSVADCARALRATEIDMTVRIQGRFADSPDGELWSPPSVDLAAALARLATRECPT